MTTITNTSIKWIALVMLCLAMGMTVEAQNDKFKPQFKLGVGGGPVYTTVDFVSKIPQTTSNGLSGGVSAKYISEKHLGLIVELNFTQRGWTEDFSEPPYNPNFSYSRTLNYIELPLLTHVYFGNKVRFVLNIGPQVSYMLGSKGNMNDALADAYANQQSADPDNPKGKQYEPLDNKFDYGLLGGAGIELLTPVGSFQLEGRYYFGLGDSFDSSRKSIGNFSRSAHRYIGGKLTYYFLSY